MMEVADDDNVDGVRIVVVVGGDAVAAAAAADVGIAAAVAAAVAFLREEVDLLLRHGVVVVAVYPLITY